MVVAVPHIDHDNGRAVILQPRHRVDHQIGTQLPRIIHQDIQSGLNAGTHDQGRDPQKLFH